MGIDLLAKDTLEERKEKIRALVDKHFNTREEKAAILGNIDVETGGSYDYLQAQKGADKPATGLIMMEEPMRNSYDIFLKNKEKEDSDESQILFLRDSLYNNQNPTHDIGQGNRQEIIKSFGSGDVDKATETISDRFFNPGEPHLDRRKKSSKEWYDKISSLNPFQVKEAYADEINPLDLLSYPDAKPKKQEKPIDLLAKFDADKDDYDMLTAVEGGLEPDKTGHWGSRVKLTEEKREELGLPESSAIILKGKNHKTWDKTVKGEKDAGFKIIRIGNRDYSVPEDYGPINQMAGKAQAEAKKLAKSFAKANVKILDKVIMPVFNQETYGESKIPKIGWTEFATGGLSLPAKVMPWQEQAYASMVEESGASAVMSEWGKAIAGQTTPLTPSRVKKVWRAGLAAGRAEKPYSYKQLFTELGYSPVASEVLGYLGRFAGTPSSLLYFAIISPASYKVANYQAVKELRELKEINVTAVRNLYKAIKQGVITGKQLRALKASMPADKWTQLNKGAKDLYRILSDTPLDDYLGRPKMGMIKGAATAQIEPGQAQLPGVGTGIQKPIVTTDIGPRGPQVLEGIKGIKPGLKPTIKPVVVPSVSKPPVVVTKKKEEKAKVIPAKKGLKVFPEKEQLLIQIDEAITKAPNKADVKEPTKVTFETDGGANIINTKESLTAFKEIIAKTPAVMKEKKVPKLPSGSTTGKKEDIGKLYKGGKDGWFTDGKLLIKGKVPKSAKYDDSKPAIPKDDKTVQTVIDEKGTPAEFEYYFTKTTIEEGKSTQPIASYKDDSGETITGKVLFKTEDGYYTYEQNKFNAIRNRYPNATYKITKGGVLKANYQNQPVAILLPVLTGDYKKLPLKQPPITEGGGIIAENENLAKPEDKGEIARRLQREESERPGETLPDKIARKEKEIAELRTLNKKAEDIDEAFESKDILEKLERELVEDKETYELLKEKYAAPVDLLADQPSVRGAGVDLLAGDVDTGDPSMFGGIDKYEKSEPDPKEGPTQVPIAEFKLFEKVKTLIHKYANKFGEKYNPRGTLGIYYHKTTNIFLYAVNSLSVAVHEVVHYVDKNTNYFTSKIMRTVGEGTTGKPIYDPTTLKMRQELTAIYVQYYPGGRTNHKLMKRMTEGIAVFIQNMVIQPSRIKQEYPYLVEQILTPGKTYYEKTFVDLIKDGRDIIDEYSKLDPLQQVGSKIITDTQEGVKDQFIKIEDKILNETLDRLSILEKLSKQGGVWFTDDDPSLWARFYSNVSSIVMKNIIGRRGYWTLDQRGKLFKKFEYNWKTLINTLQSKSNINDFANWLVARQQTASYEHLEVLRQKALQAAEMVNKLRQELGASFETYQGVKKVLTQAKQASEEYNHLKGILRRDGFDVRVVKQAYETNKERFAEPVKMYDNLVRADLDLMASPLVQLLLPKQYEELKTRVGYTPLKREMYNDILGIPPASVPLKNIKIGKQISSLLPRKGSELSIINPLYQSIVDHREIFTKSMRQLVYNKVAKLADKFPDLFQEVKLIRSVDKKMIQGTMITKISYPQEKDPNIMMVRLNGKRVPFLVSKEIKAVIDECLTYQNVHLIEEVFTGASRLFTKGTTGMYPWFAVSNFFVDQVTATVQSYNKFVPFFSPVRQVFKMLVNFQGEEAFYFKEYLELGGERQTLVGFMDKTPHDIFRILNAEKNALEKVVDTLKGGVELTAEVLSTLSKYSELVTRGADYVLSRKAGKSQMVALEQAGRVTAPFHHIGRHQYGGKGTTGRSFIRSLPFFNASLEVLAQFGRTIKGGTGGPGTTKGEKEALKTQNKAVFVWSALTIAIIGSFSYLYKKSTKEQRELYKNLTPTELINYIWIPALNGKDLMRWRVPEQMAVIGGLMNMVLADNLMNTNYTAQEYLEGATAWIPDQLNVTDPYRQFFALFPQILKPITGVVTGKRFYPRVTPLESVGMQGVRPGERFTETTSMFAKKLGQELDISPVKIDFLIEGYMGRAMRIFIGKDPGNPLLRKFYFHSGRNMQFFYEARERNKWGMNDIKSGKIKANSPEGDKIIKINAKVQAIEAYLEAYRQLSIDKETDRDNPKLLHYRTQILDLVDSFRLKEGK